MKGDEHQWVVIIRLLREVVIMHVCGLSLCRIHPTWPSLSSAPSLTNNEWRRNKRSEPNRSVSENMSRGRERGRTSYGRNGSDNSRNSRSLPPMINFWLSVCMGETCVWCFAFCLRCPLHLLHVEGFLSTAVEESSTKIIILFKIS